MRRGPADVGFAELAEHLPDYLSVIDEDLSILYTNYEPRYDGHPTREELTAQTIDVYLPEEHRDEIRERIAAVFEGGPPVQFESTSADGQSHWLTRVVRYADDGETKRALLIGTEITAEVAARRELEESRRQLTRALAVEADVMRAHGMETLGRLAGGAAHDFNNLLMVIQTQVDFAREEQEAGRSCLEELADIAAAAERASSLTKQLLSLACHDDAEPRAVTVSSMLSQLTPALMTALPSSIELRVEQRADGVVMADPAQLEQAVLSLGLEVVDAFPETKLVELVIDRLEIDPHDARLVRHRTAPGRYLTISVVAPHGPVPHGEGEEPQPGLGLAVVRGLVQAQQGFAEPTTGTLGYTVFFPEQKPEAGPVRTILVAEDEAMVRSVIARTLQRAGYRVLQAADGIEALAQYEAFEGKVDLAILDAIMPRQGGRETFVALRENDPELPVLFCSGYASDTLPTELLDGDDVEILFKPVRRVDLVSAVARMLAGEA